MREVYEALAGACGSTYFVWVQHHTPVRLLAGSPNAALRDELLPALCAGRRLAAVAHAHLRRPGPPAVRARRSAGGFRLEGTAPWVTSWGIAHDLVVGARTEGGGVVFAMVPARATASVRPGLPFELAVLQATATVAVTLDGVAVPPEAVVCEMSDAEWASRDRLATALPSPASFGLASTCVRLLADRDEGAAQAFGQRWRELRRRSYDLADGLPADPADGDLDRLRDLRAQSLVLALQAAAALVTAGGGRSMLRADPAQRLLREAGFALIQAQTPPVRAAVLAQLSGLPPAPPAGDDASG